MERTLKNNLITLISGNSFLEFPERESGIISSGGAVIVIDSIHQVQEIIKNFEDLDVAVRCENLDMKENEVMNYQVGFHIYRKKDEEEKILKFLDNQTFFPVLLVVGLVPEYLEECGYICRYQEKITMEHIEICHDFMEWAIENISIMLEAIKRSKQSSYLDVECEAFRPLYARALATSYVWKAFYLSKGMNEDLVKEWQEDFLIWVLKGLNEKERFTGLYQITEALKNVFYRFLDGNNCFIIPIEEFDEDLYEYLRKKQMILYDDTYYWIPEALLNNICQPLTQSVSFKQIKKELFEEGTLICNDCSDRKFTVKKVLYSRENKEIRPRFIKILKDALLTDEGLTAEQYIEVNGGYENGN